MLKLQTNNETKVNSSENRKFLLEITLKLLVICTVTALLLSGVNALTADRIAENIRKEKAAAISAFFPNATSNELIDVSVNNVNELYMVHSDDTLLGYAAGVAPLGFGGAMEMMVGVNVDGTLAGVKLITHAETPGLGSRVGDGEYLANYVSKNAASIAAVDIITGSTISSEAIRTGTANALSAFDIIFASADVTNGGGAQ